MELPIPKKINIERYSGGLSHYKKIFHPIKLSANESAIGASPKALTVFKTMAEKISRYPDSDSIILKEAIAKIFSIEKKNLIIGAGSDQIIEFVCKLFLEKNDEVVTGQYSFIMYKIYSQFFGAKVKFADEDNFKLNVKSIIGQTNKKTKIVFVANPNNPTGTYLTKHEMMDLRKQLRSDILLVVDDAYAEYMQQEDYESGLELFKGFKNVMVTRTFSKIHGLAGLRVGWGHASEEIINAMNLIKPPFNITRPSLYTATEAIQDKAWLNKAIEHNNKWSDIMFKFFNEMKIECNKPTANFFLLQFDIKKIKSSEVFSKLAQTGILLREMNAYDIPNALRVTIGTDAENTKFMESFKKIINV